MSKQGIEYNKVFCRTTDRPPDAGQPLITTSDSPRATQDSGIYVNRHVAQFSLGLLRLAMKQMHHSLSEITSPAPASLASR